MRTPLAAALAFLAFTACGEARKTSSQASEPRGECTRCHGGADNQTGAPPGSLRGEGKDGSTSAMGVGAHTAHVEGGKLSHAFDCTACHPDPRAGSSHLDGRIQLTLDGFAHEPNASTPAPEFVPATGTCASVYCHGAFRGGNGANAPVWTQVGGGQAACGTCHGAPPAAPHPASTDCGRCHSGYAAGSVNLATHVNGKIDLDGLACTSCHGDPARAKNQAAPPLGARGESATTERAVGAHQAHLSGASLGRPVECGDCHEVPTSIAHANGVADLRFGPLATGGGSASFDGATCTTYCHGATLTNAGGSNRAPRWTGGAGEATCGTCHGVPPPSPHPSITGLGKCAACHPQTVNASGGLIPASAGGKHLDGTLQSSGHDGAGWMNPASPEFHAFSANADLASCTTCHGAALDGGTVQVDCARCHDVFPEVVPDWRQNCVMCHGNGDNRTGAPPSTTWGNGGDAVRVGAHTTHVSGSAIAPAFDCGECHVKPDDALSPGHVDGPTATVTFGTLATTRTAVPPVWDRPSATCASTYCHGGTLAGGTNTLPVWTSVGTGEASCGSCHGVPPPSPHPAVTELGLCAGCHPDTIDSAGLIIPPASGGKHLDGFSQVSGGHDASWMDPSSSGFHAYSVAAGLSSCQACHGPQLDKFANGDCAGCHGGSTWPTRCTMCHGGTDNQSGAPPRTTWAGAGDAVRVGAHTVHLAGGPMAPPFDCTVCHVKPPDAFAPGHLDGSTATVTFGGLALPTEGTATASWTRTSASCASTYCHGATLGGGTNKAPIWTGGAAQATCGSCHGIPPPAPHPAVSTSLNGCATCHGGTVAVDGALIPPASGGKHLNGQVDAGSLEAGCASCHGLPPDDGGLNGHRFHVSTTRVDCGACHAGYTRSTADPAYHMNGVRNARLPYLAPDPDPADVPPTLEACLAPASRIADIPQSSNPTVWDTNVCSSCHATRDYLYTRCCYQDGAPSPEWCWY